MGAVSHSRGPAGSRTRLTRARATAGSGGRVGGRHFQQVSREDQEPSPTSVGHVMPTLALGGPALGGDARLQDRAPLTLACQQRERIDRAAAALGCGHWAAPLAASLAGPA